MINALSGGRGTKFPNPERFQFMKISFVQELESVRKLVGKSHPIDILKVGRFLRPFYYCVQKLGAMLQDRSRGWIQMVWKEKGLARVLTTDWIQESYHEEAGLNCCVQQPSRSAHQNHRYIGFQTIRLDCGKQLRPIEIKRAFDI
ncbi:hypothetical protein Tco_1028849 [Tanacetum coccineum]|uniref:Uncharacterized protein n=1 Tax=Tanacetum coccineum TaxID=301880 RepID=A0ABQ5G3A2_9ASTR